MKQLTATELKEWQQQGKDYVLIDIREAWERKLFNIGGHHIPMGELFGQAKDLPADKDIVLYCEKGIRSVIAIQRLEGAGFHNFYNLAGGMKAWKEPL